MNIFHTYGIVPYRTNRTQLTEDAPDLEGIIKDKVKDVVYELERIDFSNDSRQDIEHGVGSAVRSLSHFQKDIPQEMDTYLKEGELIRGMVEDMGNSGLDAMTEVGRLEKQLLSLELPDTIKESLTDQINSIKASLEGVITNQSTSLVSMLSGHGWSAKAIGRVCEILNADTVYMDILSEYSSTNRLHFGKDSWLTYDGIEVSFKTEHHLIKINPSHTSLYKNGDRVNHKWADLGGYFNDWLNPTLKEQAVYTMATEKSWDISGFHEELLLEMK